jgi:hypothetical protein
MMWQVLLLLVGAALITSLDPFRLNCGHETAATVIILFVHHVAHLFANFGWLFSNQFMLYLYLLTPIVTRVHWAMNDNLCVSTQVYNRMCGLSDTVLFNDVYKITGLAALPHWNPMHFIYLLTTYAYVIFYKLKW